MAYDYVPIPSSPYYGWRKPQILEALAKIDDALLNAVGSPGNIASVSLNGKSVSFFDSKAGQSSQSELIQQKSDLVQCLALLDSNYNTTTDMARVAFR